MEYNSRRSQLIVPEYGRNIQSMVEHLLTEKDDEKRNQGAREVIDLMGYWNPHLRDVPDFKHKLWDHLFMISGYKLDVDSPYPKPNPADKQVKPKKLEYRKHKIKFRVYGRNIEEMIAKAIELEDGEEKTALTVAIANFMKIAHKQWNKEIMDDAIIFDNLNELSGGKLKVDPELKLIIPQSTRPRNDRSRNDRDRNKRHQQRRKKR